MVYCDIDAENITIELAGAITPSDAETILEIISRDRNCERRVILNFSKVTYISSFAASRIGNALTSHVRMRHITVEVSKEMILGGSDWFRTFTLTGLGDSLVHSNATFRTSNENVSDQVRDYYVKRKERIGNTEFSITDITAPGSIEVDDYDLFAESFTGRLRQLDVMNREIYEDRRSAMNAFAFEALQNIYDHAGRHPLPLGANIFSAFRITYHQALYDQKDDIEHLENYLKRIDTTCKQANRATPSFLKVTIIDGGVGIAARQCGTFDIYAEGQFKHEHAAFKDVFTNRLSSKLRWGDSVIRGKPGYGFVNMLHGLQRAQAFAILRTGRCAAVFAWEGQVRPGFVILPDIFSFMPGTAYEIIVPLIAQ